MRIASVEDSSLELSHEVTAHLLRPSHFVMTENELWSFENKNKVSISGHLQ